MKHRNILAYFLLTSLPVLMVATTYDQKLTDAKNNFIAQYASNTPTNGAIKASRFYQDALNDIDTRIQKTQENIDGVTNSTLKQQKLFAGLNTIKQIIQAAQKTITNNLPQIMSMAQQTIWQQWRDQLLIPKSDFYAQYQADQTVVQSDLFKNALSAVDTITASAQKKFDAAATTDIAKKQSLSAGLTAISQVVTTLEQNILEFKSKIQANQKLWQSWRANLTKQKTDFMSLYQSRPEIVQTAQYKTALEKIDGTIATAQANFDTATGTDIAKKQALNSGLAAINQVINIQKQSILSVQEIQRRQLLLKKQNLYTDLSTTIGTLTTIDQAANDHRSQHVQTKISNLDTIRSIATQYQTAAKKFSSIYQKNASPITITDKSNLVMTTLNRLQLLLLDDIAQTAQIANNDIVVFAQKEGAYQLLSDLASRVSAYDTLFINAVTSVITTKNDQTSLIDAYKSKRKQITFTLFSRTLQDFIINIKDPTEEQAEYAQNFYQGAIGDVSQTDSAAQDLNTKLALLNIARAQTVLKELRIAVNTTKQLSDIIDHYQKAASYYQKANNTGTAQLYTSIAQALLNAQKLRIQADQTIDINQATPIYQNAIDQFGLGGDAIDKAATTLQLYSRQASEAVAEGKKLMDTFVTDFSVLFQTYLTFISTDQTQGIDIYNYNVTDQLLDGLTKAAQDAVTQYKNALDLYTKIDLEFSGYSITDKTISGIQQLSLKNTIAYLKALIGARSFFTTGNTFALKETITDLSQANANYAQAITSYTTADTIYQADPTISSLTSFAPNRFKTDIDTTDWNFMILAERTIAKILLTIGRNQKLDTSIQLQYLTSLKNKQWNFIPEALQTLVQTNLDILLQNKKLVDQIFAQAQASQQAAEQMSPSDWQAIADQATYRSTASQAWQKTLNLYANAFTQGKKEAGPIYANVSDLYAQAYLANVPENYFPLIETILIYWTKYQLDLSVDTLSTIGIVCGKLFDSIQSMLTETTAPSTAITASKQIIAMLKYLDAAVNRQATVTDQLGLSPPQATQLLFDKVINQINGDRTYRYTAGKKTGAITIPEPQLVLGKSYQLLADTQFAQKIYNNARDNYGSAYNIYKTLNLSSTQTTIYNQYQLARTRAAADTYQLGILPNATQTNTIPLTTVAKVTQIPTTYQLNVYELPISPELLEYVALQKTATQPAQTTAATLIEIATIMFLDQSVQEYNYRFQNVFLASSPTPQLISPLPYGMPASTAQTILQRGLSFKQDLTQRIQNKKSNLYLTVKNNQQVLGELYKPIPPIPPLSVDAAIPIIPLPYQNFPTTLSYLTAAKLLYTPGTQTVQLARTTWAPGNDQASANSLVERIAQAYLSESIIYKQCIDFVNGSQILLPIILSQNMQTALQTAKTDLATISTAPAISTVLPSYNLVRNYYLNILLPLYAYAQNEYATIGSDNQTVLNEAIPDILVQAGTVFKKFLIGDPLAMDYYTVMGDISKTYKTAIAYDPTREESLYNDLSKLFMAAGDQLSAQKRYFSAVPFYLNAELSLNAISNPSAITLANTLTAMLTKVRTQILGASSNLANFQKRIEVPQFQTIVTNYVAWAATQQTLQPTTLTGAELKTFNQVKDNFLDALIFLTSVSGQATQAQINRNSTIDQAAQKLIDAYTKAEKIDFSSIQTIKSIMQADGFKTVAAAQNPIIKGFEKFAAHVEINRDVGLSAIANWANLCYIAFSKIYMDTYLGGELPDKQWIDLLQAIKSEEQEILAPANNYF